MRLPAGEPLDVILAYAPADEVTVGRLAIDGWRAVLEYSEAFIASGARLHPLWPPPTRSLVLAQNPRAFRGMHGVFADSLPDAWGHELMRRRVGGRGVNYDELSGLDRLALVGNSGVGALVYRPDYSEHTDGGIDLDQLAGGVIELDAAPAQVIEKLARLGGSSGGARPKVFVARNAVGHLIAGNREISDGYEPYLVKFRGSMDRADIGPLEAAYADAARSAGVDVPSTLLIPATRGPGYFATRRFDRGPAGVRIPMLSAAALLDADWSADVFDYEKLIALTGNLTHSRDAAEQMFRRMVFNVLSANGDDHLKQHSFLQRRTGEWTLAPAYDLTLSSAMNGYRYLLVNGKGRDIAFDDIAAVARESNIKKTHVRAIVDDVRAAVAGLPAIARDYGVTPATLAAFKRATEHTAK